MATEDIIDPEKFFKSFSLHDVGIEGINLDFESQSVEIKVEDLNWNYEGSPEYKERPCSIFFNDVVRHSVDIMDTEGIVIGRASSKGIDGLYQVELDLRLGGGDNSWGKGRSSIEFTFKTMKIVDRL